MSTETSTGGIVTHHRARDSGVPALGNESIVGRHNGDELIARRRGRRVVVVQWRRAQVRGIRQQDVQVLQRESNVAKGVSWLPGRRSPDAREKL